MNAVGGCKFHSAANAVKPGTLENAKPKEAHLWERHAQDWYVEPSWAVDLLIDAEAFEGRIFDPCCGMGTIPKAFLARGYEAHGTDLVYRGFGLGGQNFLAWDRKNIGPSDNIVTNPPFQHAEQFNTQSLRFARRKVCMFLPLKFLASRRRKVLFEEHWPLARVHVLSNRASCLPGHLVVAGQAAKGGAIDYAWFVFERGHKGLPSLHWLATPGPSRGPSRIPRKSAPEQALKSKKHGATTP